MTENRTDDRSATMINGFTQYRNSTRALRGAAPARGRPSRPNRIRPSYHQDRRPGRNRATRIKSRRWVSAAVLLALAAFAVVVTFSVRAHDQGCPALSGTIIWADQVTAEEGGSSSPPADLVATADALAACGDGQLILIRGAGQGGVQAGPAVSLRVYRAPGEPENDPTVRNSDVQQLLSNAFHQAADTPVSGDGRDVIGLLTTISAELGSGQNDVWLRTLGLPTVAPADARVLMAADPAEAVASIAKWVPPLHGVKIHLILSPAAGDQPRLNSATSAWRLAFMLGLLHQAGADVVSVQQVETPEQAAPGAPPAPVVANLPELTPAMPRPPVPHQPYQLNLDSATFFLPNSTQFAASPARVLAELQPIITAWRTGEYSQVRVVGHCAMFGPRQGALLLSQQRAAIVAGLLRQHGVSDVTSVGVGYNDPLPPSPQSASNRVVIITAIPKT
jgi:outer membrane protein OmpA-like peptidoglycan-associated protein